jgi:hypothetical protein
MLEIPDKNQSITNFLTTNPKFPICRKHTLSRHTHVSHFAGGMFVCEWTGTVSQHCLQYTWHGHSAHCTERSLHNTENEGKGHRELREGLSALL